MIIKLIEIIQNFLFHSLNLQIEKFDEGPEDAVLVEEDHVLLTLVKTFRIRLAFQPASYKKKKTRNGINSIYWKKHYSILQ